ncbi:MAG TPA: hypothetical protein PKO09_09070 [Anaerolineae bacterium]|nr:hypothetical protein [Anaerolineae bacterium]
MKGHILSLVLIVLGIAVFLFSWLVGENLWLGLLFGLILVLPAIILFRRGK